MADDYNTRTDLVLPLPVPNNTAAGDLLVLEATLLGLAITPQATSDLISKGACVGLTAGQASVQLINKTVAITLTIVGAIAQFAKVYKASDGTYTATATNNTYVGHALEALAGDGNALCVIG